jgi:hypothetical protein
MAVTKRTIELPTGGLVGVVRSEGQFTNAKSGGHRSISTAIALGRQLRLTAAALIVLPAKILGLELPLPLLVRSVQINDALG